MQHILTHQPGSFRPLPQPAKSRLLYQNRQFTASGTIAESRMQDIAVDSETRNNPAASKRLLELLTKNKLFYGSGMGYGSLITPTSTCLTLSEAQDLRADLSEIWATYRTWTSLYVASLSGNAPRWISEYVESGMGKEEVAVNRSAAISGIEPCFCRSDYVSIGQKRGIAEVQWKSGGPGLFFGISDCFSAALNYQEKTEPLGNLTRNFFDSIRSFGNVAVNLVRDVWLNGETYLSGIFGRVGLAYLPINRIDCGIRLVEKQGAYFVQDDSGKLLKVDFLIGQGFTQFFPKSELEKLARAVFEKKLWIETPLNYIYRQKWGMALPFMEEFSELFGDRTREIFIPTALLAPSGIRFGKFIQYVDHPQRELLLGVTSLEQLAGLPESLRKSLVLKCGSGVGDFYSNGKGVFRLSGSRAYAGKILDFINHRMESYSEPWIIQPFVNETHTVPVSMPSSPDDMFLIQAHARFMIFGSRLGQEMPTLMGGLANYGRYWKVSGSSAGKDGQGNILGSAFNDIRITLE